MNSWTADMFYESMICCVCTCMSITANDFSPILSSTTQPDSICLSPHISLYIFVHAKTVAVELSQHAHVHMYIVWYWFWDIYSIHVSECMYTLYVYVDTCIHTYEDERRYAKNPEYVNLECATVYVNPHGGCMKPATETCADGVLLVCTGTLISPSTPWLRFRPAFLTLSPNLSMYSCPQAMLMICCAASREHLWSGACAWCGMYRRLYAWSIHVCMIHFNNIRIQTYVYLQMYLYIEDASAYTSTYGVHMTAYRLKCIWFL